MMQIIAYPAGTAGEVDTLGNATTYIAVNTSTNKIDLYVNGVKQAEWA